MTDENIDGPTRQSSPRFPFIALSKAVQRAQELRDAAGTSLVPMEQVREIWGYGPKSSGGDQTVASLGYYGLLEEGSAANGVRRLKLTDIAVRYLREERVEERQRILSELVIKPKAMQTLWGLWGREIPPSVAVARSILKNDQNFSDSAANQVLEVYRSNLQYFPDSNSVKLPENEQSFQEPETKAKPLPPARITVGDWVQWTSKGADQFPSPRKVTWLSTDGFLRVEGSMTGIPIAEVRPAAAPAPKPGGDFVLQHPPPGELQVLLTGGRLQITADVDLEGIKRLQALLAKYEEILVMMKPN